MIKDKTKITEIKKEIFKEQGIKNRDSWNYSLIDKLVDELIETRSKGSDKLKE